MNCRPADIVDDQIKTPIKELSDAGRNNPNVVVSPYSMDHLYFVP